MSGPLRTLAEIRASGRVSLPEWVEDVCLNQRVMSQMQALNEERQQVVMDEMRAKSQEDGDERPKRMVQPKDPRLAEIDAEVETLWDEAREDTVRLSFRAWSPGKWRRWVEDNPAREDGRDEDGTLHFNPVDAAITGGFCDASALMDALGGFVVACNGAAVSEDDWAFLIDSMAPGDVKQMLTRVVERHEGPGVRAPKVSSTRSLPTASSADDSSSPGDSASRRSDSSAGSRSSATSTATRTAS